MKFSILLKFFLFQIVYHFSLQDSPKCGPLEASFGNKCYRFVNQPMNFTSALSYCQSIGYSLVSIHSMAENSFLQKQAGFALGMTYQSFYIGLYSPSRQTNNWVYTDGSAYDFTNWIQGEPSGARWSVGFRLSDGKWQTVSNSASIPFVCSATFNNTSPASTTMVPMTTTFSGSGSTVSLNCAPQLTTYYLFHFVDGSGTSDATFTSTQELVTIMSSSDNLDLDNRGIQQNTRYMFGLMGSDFIGFPNNVTNVQQIYEAFNSLNSRIPFPPIFINYTASLTQMANNSIYNRFDPNKEAPPVAILYPGVQNVYGAQNIKDGVTALTNLGFKVLAVNMNAGITDLTANLNDALGPDNVYTYASTTTDAVAFIMRRLCIIKPTLS
ncbi:hypothetical protein WR25_25633 isoform A [Diploscapter pachys]|uniref:C-type lectin domain-containing protein n=2 Tax=Diploscapter pachys TaxID=2018661 RepID=A0A2A2KL83_9BILA|nr:hypothetical protein WR25_25633 isoform A [Diploscapter pachys]